MDSLSVSEIVLLFHLFLCLIFLSLSLIPTLDLSQNRSTMRTGALCVNV